MMSLIGFFSLKKTTFRCTINYTNEITVFSIEDKNYGNKQYRIRC